MELAQALGAFHSSGVEIEITASETQKLLQMFSWFYTYSVKPFFCHCWHKANYVPPRPQATTCAWLLPSHSSFPCKSFTSYFKEKKKGNAKATQKVLQYHSCSALHRYFTEKVALSFSAQTERAKFCSVTLGHFTSNKESAWKSPPEEICF